MMKQVKKLKTTSFSKSAEKVDYEYILESVLESEWFTPEVTLYKTMEEAFDGYLDILEDQKPVLFSEFKNTLLETNFFYALEDTKEVWIVFQLIKKKHSISKPKTKSNLLIGPSVTVDTIGLPKHKR